MEKKTKHRILGLFVVIGLVIILLPFFQASKELNTDATLVKAPAFPSQAAEIKPEQPPAPIIANAPTQSADNLVNQQPDDTIDATQKPLTNVKAPEISSPATAVTPKPTSEPINTRDGNADALNTQPSIIKKIAKPQSHHKVAIQGPLDSNGLMKLKTAVWVIQVGSYKNKTSALRVVNKLRASGYPAFIQQMNSSLGQHTQVFIGPEIKQANAISLADELEAEMHIRVIIISYKPLAL
jgi:DedD protein